MTVTPDGRILIERDNLRIQAFDTVANPVNACRFASIHSDSSFQTISLNNISAILTGVSEERLLPASLTPSTLGLTPQAISMPLM